MPLWELPEQLLKQYLPEKVPVVTSPDDYEDTAISAKPAPDRFEMPATSFLSKAGEGGTANPSPNLVSVIIPCYNQARYLRQAIESTLAQSYSPLEVIIVDDGSTDETSQVATSFPNITLLQQSNAGLAAARNAGLRKSKGDYVLFLDSDDRLLPNALAAHTKTLSEHQEAAFVYGHCTFISPHGQQLFTPQQTGITDNHYRHLLNRCFIWTPGTVTFRRSIFDVVGEFDTSVSPTADYDMYLRIARQFPVFCQETIVLEYRQHPSNMSGNAELMLGSVIRVLDAQAEHVKGSPDLEAALQNGKRWYNVYYADPLVQDVRSRAATRTEQISELLKERPADEHVPLIQEWQALFEWSSKTLDLVWRTPLITETAERRERHQIERAREVSKLRQELATALENQKNFLAKITEFDSDRRQLLAQRDALRTEVIELQALLLQTETKKNGKPLPEHLKNIREGTCILTNVIELINRTLPEKATVLVVSKGEERLLELNGRTAFHFPQAPEGVYAGYHPLDDAEAIQHLQDLRNAGAEYIIFPGPSLWWLDYYTGFARYLNERHEKIASEPGVCTIYRLRG
jgi:glycosyltransferase involved in cell wall biosynthesis